MANSVDQDVTAPYEPSHLDLHCLHTICYDLPAERVCLLLLYWQIQQTRRQIGGMFLISPRKYAFTLQSNPKEIICKDC